MTTNANTDLTGWVWLTLPGDKAQGVPDFPGYRLDVHDVRAIFNLRMVIEGPAYAVALSQARNEQAKRLADIARPLVEASPVVQEYRRAAQQLAKFRAPFFAYRDKVNERRVGLSRERAWIINDLPDDGPERLRAIDAELAPMTARLDADAATLAALEQAVAAKRKAAEAVVDTICAEVDAAFHRPFVGVGLNWGSPEVTAAAEAIQRALAPLLADLLRARVIHDGVNRQSVSGIVAGLAFDGV